MSGSEQQTEIPEKPIPEPSPSPEPELSPASSNIPSDNEADDIEIPELPPE
jgi:hypothetical protein